MLNFSDSIDVFLILNFCCDLVNGLLLTGRVWRENANDFLNIEDLKR